MKTHAAAVGLGDVMRPKPAPFASAGSCVTTAPVPRASAAIYECGANDSISGSLGEAIEAKQRDNLVLGETLVSFGLLQRDELSEVQRAQTRNNDVVGSLTVASAIRTRLGDILLHAKQITSQQLELALELQRQRDGLLGEILVGMGVLDHATLDAALAAQAGRKTER